MADRKKTDPQGLTSRQERFSQLVASGKSHSEAYREAYGRPDVSVADAGERGHRVAKHPLVRERIASLRARSERKALLTLNERLAYLAAIIQNPNSTASEVARAVEVYSKLAGDAAPARMEVTGANGAPIAVQTARLTVPQRLEIFRARRLAAPSAVQALGSSPKPDLEVTPVPAAAAG
ncbi:MAG TPA: hypothetical protein VFE31_08890 [Opitutaceae bacterium]|jgi:hypothetical protein|nr:hypothetical protein [Opitutaceae bacterium]